MNSNPFNIEDDGTPWRGKVGADGRYLIFGTPHDGMRAGFRDLYVKWSRDGLRTAAKILFKYAPPTRQVKLPSGAMQTIAENDTEAYITAVCRDCGVTPDQLLDFDNLGQFLKFGRAIMRHECGMVPYPTADIVQAMQAGYPDGHKSSASPAP